MEQSVESAMQETMLTNPNGNRNTGTYLMTDTLAKIIDADEFIPRFHNFETRADTVVTNILHRIGTNLKVDLPYWENILNHADRVIPLSLGFAFDKGKIAPLDRGLEKLLRMLAERAEIGVRGEYDADYLNGYGIKNVRIIGCPSMFYHLNREFTVNSNVNDLQRINFNFSTDFANLGISQKDAVEIHWPLLRYFIDAFEQKLFSIDFTLQKPPFAEVCDIHSILLSYGEVHHFYSACGRYFYSAKDWIEGMRNNDFSIGTRFHGNIAAILARVPALMINLDKRMEEMNKFYKIPAIDISDFDNRKPIEYYGELADYSEFNKCYGKVYDNFVNYCEKNGVKLKHRRNNHE
jgi:hypothetical protein